MCVLDSLAPNKFSVSIAHIEENFAEQSGESSLATNKNVKDIWWVGWNSLSVIILRIQTVSKTACSILKPVYFYDRDQLDWLRTTSNVL